MKIYHGGSWLDKENYFSKERFNNYTISVLQSYIDHKKILKRANTSDFLFFDSGAFSVWSRGIKINIQEYIDFLHKYKTNIDIYASLDDIENPEISWKNYIEMKEQGLAPLPVYHKGEDIKWLKRYMQKTNYIGLGGIAKTSKKERHLFLKDIFLNFPNIKFHGFGVTDVEIMKRYNWESVDSVTATIAGVMGEIRTPFGRITTSSKSPKKESFFLFKESLVKEKLKDYLDALNICIQKVQLESKEGIQERIMANFLYLENCIKNPIRKKIIIKNTLF